MAEVKGHLQGTDHRQHQLVGPQNMTLHCWWPAANEGDNKRWPANHLQAPSTSAWYGQKGATLHKSLLADAQPLSTCFAASLTAINTLRLDTIFFIESLVMMKALPVSCCTSRAVLHNSPQQLDALLLSAPPSSLPHCCSQQVDALLLEAPPSSLPHGCPQQLDALLLSAPPSSLPHCCPPHLDALLLSAPPSRHCAAGHRDEDENIWPDSLLLDGICLPSAARVTVQQPAMFPHVCLAQAVGDHLDHHLIGHQVACVHVLLGFLPSRRAGLDLGTQQVAHRDVHQAKLQGKAVQGNLKGWLGANRF